MLIKIMIEAFVLAIFKEIFFWEYLLKYEQNCIKRKKMSRNITQLSFKNNDIEVFRNKYYWSIYT